MPTTMPLDEPTRRLAFLLQRDLRRQTERAKSRSERGEAIRYDAGSGMAIWETRRGEVIGRWYAEVIARYDPKDRILRWAWAGRASHASLTHADVMVREAQARNVPQLGMSVVGDLDEEDACTLARIGVILAQGEGLELRRDDTEIALVGLFDSARPREGTPSDPSRYSVPPPAVAPRVSSPPTTKLEGRIESRPPLSPRSAPPPRNSSTPPPVAPYRSLPPIQEIWEPRAGGRALDNRQPESGPAAGARPPAARASSPPVREPNKIREPARALFVPVATAVLATLAKVVPRFQQALFVVTVHAASGGDRPGPVATLPGLAPPLVPSIGTSSKDAEKRRLVVMLVAVDEGGILRSLDPSSELVDVAARMVEADRADGNGPWRKLSARISPKADGGATLNVDVV